ncbi:SpoIIIAH-like family protein [Paenibacillus hexagrammi]|uniref:SpoIIIAH-like family protein n=1 Tax=Paenibacillus hexagrammi TaxID=2908839 RepID=A0ABY3SBH3_9BACL|nr:SpoIIIAH-like family protein [Paenibacillus sp. YPD9-1]UJF31256.1 SpoIIIAH-like family protein [Paenibacillus sp. YPD9-1]
MNAKRQTIWLVSMLSLMVVLSAYYLFTEDVNKLDLAATESAKNPQEVKIDMTQLDPASAATGQGKADAKATTGTDTKTDAKASSTKTDTKSGAKTDAKADPQAAANAANDAKIIQQVEEQSKATSASDYFTNAQMKRHEDFTKKSSDLLDLITDKNQTPDAVAKANNELESLSNTYDKIENLEGLLLKDFPQAIVTQEGKDWKVTVQADKLEKSQGVTIVDMVMNELAAQPENIKIQYVRP